MQRVLPAEELRWRCDAGLVRFKSTAAVAAGPRVPGQAPAVEAFRFGTECDAPCQNILVRGREDVGGREMALDLLREACAPCDLRPDYAYVRNFADPWRPRLVAMPPGSGPEFRRSVRELGARVGDAKAGSLARRIAKRFRDPRVAEFLDDALEHAAHGKRPESASRAFEVPAFEVHAFDVNVVKSRARDGARIVVEAEPTVENLLGTAKPGAPDGSDAHLRFQAGSILRADGGFLVLDALDLLAAPGAARALARTLRSGRVEPTTRSQRGTRIRPEPAPVLVRVVVVGDPDACDVFMDSDPALRHLFKVLADLENTMDRGPEAASVYASFLARLAKDEGLLPFDRSAIEALLEHGARIAARADQVTARLWRIADLAREADFLAHGARGRASRRADVEEAVRRTRRRGSLEARRFQQFVTTGGLRVRVHGEAVAQVNGLSVTQAGPLTYGVPTRITASVAPGTSGFVDVEKASALSGAIHVKGFQILEGLLRSLLLDEHILSFGASIALEQTYGGVDGDSAAVAEACCLLSALTRVPIRQGLAVTGSVDQLGNVQAIGGVNEKIEGFFDTCRTLGLDGEQGVIVPADNARDLMLREDVVQACHAGQFRVVTVERIHDAIEALTGVPAGEPDEAGVYPEGTLLRLAVERSEAFWQGLARAEPVPPPDARHALRTAQAGRPRARTRRRSP